jgi:parallel beta-helix repeat protein
MIVRNHLFWLLSGVIAALTAFPAAATTYYVAPNGSDTNAGTAAAPWRTLQKAADTMTPGDTARIADGDYSGGIVQSTPGTTNAPITFQADHPGLAVVHGDQTTARDAFFVTYADYIVVDGLTIRQANRAGIRIDNSNSVTVRNCRLLNNARWGIFTDFSDDLLLEYNECAGSVLEHGIYVSNSGDRPVIRFNTVHDNNAAGIQINADPAEQDASLGTRGDGITENAVVESNIVFGNGAGGTAGINLASVRSSRIVNNLLYNNLAGGIAGWDDGDGIEWGCKNNIILHNTVYFRPGEGRWCVSLKNGSTGNVVENNILWGGARGAIEYDNDSSLQSDYNLLRSVGGWGVATDEDTDAYYAFSDWQAASGNDTHSSVADPLFVHPAGAPYDFHLDSGSPAIDSGIDRPDVTADLDGHPRPIDARWDIGCYERAPAAVTVSGVITLSGCVNMAQTIAFTFRPKDGSADFTRTTSLNSDGSFRLNAVSAGVYALAMKGSRWLQKVVNVDATGGDVSGIAATLLPGDINNDNKVTITDLGLLADAFHTTPTSSHWNADADLNCDGKVDITDLGLLADNFNRSGDP